MTASSSRSSFNQSAEYHTKRAAEYRRQFGEQGTTTGEWDVSLIDLAVKHDKLAKQANQ